MLSDETGNPDSYDGTQFNYIWNKFSLFILGLPVSLGLKLDYDHQ